MRLFIYFGMLLVVLSLTSCMKKSTTRSSLRAISQTDDYASLFTPRDPLTYRGSECPNGLNIQVQTLTPSADLRANSPISFEVSVSGCKFGYDASHQIGEVAPMLAESFSSNPDMRRSIVYRTRFTRTFSAVGSYRVRVNIYPKSSETNGNYTSFFEGIATVNIVAAPTYSCSVSPATFSVRSGSISSQQSFVVTSTAPTERSPQISEVVGLDGTNTTGYVQTPPTLPISLPSANAIGVTVGRGTGTIRFRVNTNDGAFSYCNAQGVVESATDIRGNFSGSFPGTKEDRLYFVASPIGSGGYDVKVDYTNARAEYQTLILNLTLPTAELPERLFAGDVDQDGKDDVILFKAGNFRWMQSKGNPGGFNAPQALGGGWSTTRVMTGVSFVPASNGNGPRLDGYLNGVPHRSQISPQSVTEPIPSPGEVFLTLNTVNLTGATVTADLTWRGSNITACELLKCDVPQSSTTCQPNTLAQSALSLNSPNLQVAGLTASQALAVRCLQVDSSTPVISNPPVLVRVGNTCPISQLVLSQSTNAGAVGLNNFNLPLISFPADVFGLDVKMTQINVDDHSPNITVNGRQAFQLNQGLSQRANSLTGLNYSLGSFLNPGVNFIRCSAQNLSPNGNPSGCTIFLTGSYKTYGSCAADLRLSPIVGNIESITGKRLTGYACESGSPRSINLEVWVGAPGVPTHQLQFVGTFPASVASGNPVGVICNSTGTAHRFSIDVNPWIGSHRGKLIYVKGMHSNLSQSALLGNSGILAVPNQ